MSVCFIHEANTYQALAMLIDLCSAHTDFPRDGTWDPTAMGKRNWNGFSVPHTEYKFPIPAAYKYSRL